MLRLEPLQPEDAMTAMIEVQAAILADMGIMPRIPEFERFAVAYLALLASRVHDICAAA